MSENKFNIRLGELKDIPGVLLMMYEYLRETEGVAVDEPKKDLIRQEVVTGFIQRSVVLLIAETKKGKKIREVGYGVFDIRPNIFGDKIAWGHHLYVKPEYRNSGLTGMMIADAELLAREAGASEFYIDTAKPGLFKRLGYADKYAVVSKRLEAVKNVE